MIAPSKGVAADRALLIVGGEILGLLKEPTSMGQLWARLTQSRSQARGFTPIPFWWFVLALDALYALGRVKLEGNIVVREDFRASTHPIL
jgi:hypothetical protein